MLSVNDLNFCILHIIEILVYLRLNAKVIAQLAGTSLEACTSDTRDTEISLVTDVCRQ